VIFMIHPTKIMHLDHGIHDSHSRFVALAEPPTQDVNCILLLLILLLPFEDNIFFSALSADFPVLNNNKSDLHFPQCCALDISLQSLAVTFLGGLGCHCEIAPHPILEAIQTLF